MQCEDPEYREFFQVILLPLVYLTILASVGLILYICTSVWRTQKERCMWTANLHHHLTELHHQQKSLHHPPTKSSSSHPHRQLIHRYPDQPMCLQVYMNLGNKYLLFFLPVAGTETTLKVVLLKCFLTAVGSVVDIYAQRDVDFNMTLNLSPLDMLNTP